MIMLITKTYFVPNMYPAQLWALYIYHYSLNLKPQELLEGEQKCPGGSVG